MSDSVYEKTIQKLIEGHIESPRLEARLLIADVLNTDTTAINETIILEPKLQEKLEQNILKRINKTPLDKILGHKGFYKYDFKVSEDVLSPRPETEILVEKALHILSRNQFENVLDLGLGSGCILMSILKEMPTLKGVGIDVSDKALKIAKENAKTLGIEDRCAFLHKSWFEDEFVQVLNQDFDLIVSNPPYIKSEEIANLEMEVKNHDPLLALDGGEDGLKDYRQIAMLAPKLLKKGGYILLEVGSEQADDVKQIFKKASLIHIETILDLAGIERVVVLKK